MYTVYYALVDSLLCYGLTSYGRTFKTYLDKLKLIQTRFLKLLVNNKVKKKCKSSDYEELFIECKMLPVHDKVTLLIAVQQFCSDEFKICINKPIGRRTVSKKVYEVPTYSNYFGQRKRKYMVPIIFNDLPPTLNTNKLTKRSFKNQLQKRLLIVLKERINELYNT